MTVPSAEAWTGQARRPANAASAVCRAVLAATMRRTSPGRSVSRPSPIGPPQSWTTSVTSRRPDGVGELGDPVDVAPHRVRRSCQRLVRAPESDQVGCHGPQAVRRRGRSITLR